MSGPAAGVEARARRSLGASGDPIYRMVARALEGRHPGGGTLLDVGCGGGSLWRHLAGRFDRCVGVDAVRYDALPAEVELFAHDLDAGPVPLPAESAEVVAAVETVEHLENPRALLRELARLAKPGGWVLVSTPNQLSLLSKLTLVLKNRFNAFQDASYPEHRTALLEVDLLRMAAECGLEAAEISYSRSGRVPGTGAHFPGWMSRALPRALSDNLLLAARKPVSGGRALP